ncbi:MAG: S-layer homology domain-containing protein [Thermoleophilia bacterium]|nr:S-layer homology domain-containing protein [Thermoleophilia bacterium]
MDDGSGVHGVIACRLTVPALVFTDVSGPEYGSAIGDLSARGIINGYVDGTFRPQIPVWRAYPYPVGYIAVAFAHGLTDGPGVFAPADEISRAQVITMVVRAAQNLLAVTLLLPPESYQGTWGTSFDAIHGPKCPHG